LWISTPDPWKSILYEMAAIQRQYQILICFELFSLVEPMVAVQKIQRGIRDLG
jgi:hypothetical protein